MLVLSRKKYEEILIGDDVLISVVEIRGDKVRIGITAPKDVPVHRREVYEAIRREKREDERKERADRENGEVTCENPQG